MAVTVDDQPLAIEGLGLRTVGQLLAHLKRQNRLVVHVTIDGKEPDAAWLKSIKRSLIGQHTIYIETADPKQMARSVLSEVESQLNEADRLRSETVELLGKNLPAPAMERLSGCFSTWQHAQESVLKTAQLLRIDLSCVDLHGQSFTDLLSNFTTQLKRIKQALEGRDFDLVALLLRGGT